MIIVKTKKNAFTRYLIRIIVTLIIAFIKHGYNKRFKILYHSIDCKYFKKEIYIILNVKYTHFLKESNI